mmetsp:Transcript_18683/g.45123  ORF Transcript_18683/g.45123 Transcript_18683/m.45123 type:complete len:315 (+) Transcript_18683:93-1037(+)
MRLTAVVFSTWCIIVIVVVAVVVQFNDAVVDAFQPGATTTTMPQQHRTSSSSSINHHRHPSTLLMAGQGPTLLDNLKSSFSGKQPDEEDEETLSERRQREKYPEMQLTFIEDDNEEDPASSFSYAAFAKDYPFANNVMIATVKTAAADLLAQTVIAQTPIDSIDWERSFLFCVFGAVYLGGFQYLYQVNIFKKLFDVDKFTSQSWGEKIRDGPGLTALAAQTAVDLGVLTAIYLPTFYIFKASVFSGSLEPSVWVDTGITNYQTNFAKDELDLLRVWFPADLVCFSVPLYLRLPVRHVVSFVWTAYLSFSRGGH